MEPSSRSRLRSGEPAAFEQLFDENAGAIYRYAVRTTANWAAAEDIVSLTFLEAWRLRDTLHAAGGSVRPWLYAIATNVLRNATRAARRHRAAMASLPAPVATPDFADELVGRLADAEQLAAAQAALATLRRPEREVFALCVWSGLDYAEAAAALGIPLGTVKSRLSRARARLQKLSRELAAAPAGLPALEPLVPAGQISSVRSSAVRSSKEQNR
jgi:RNA polymerase sigma-70 factor (ECF subfamily)